MSSFKLWLRYAKPTHGRLLVDEGAERALRERGTSLLPVGVVDVEGEFEAGDAVEVRCDGRAVGKGIVNYSAAELRRIKGMKTDAVRGCCRGPPRRPCTATTSCSSSAACRSPYDREILRLAVPALGALAAEPLYLLADTAMVGHLGTPELAALAIAGDAAHRRVHALQLPHLRHHRAGGALHGAGEEVAAGRLAAQALWLSAGIGVVPGRTARGAGGAARAPAWAATGATGDLAVLVPPDRVARAAVRADRARRPGLPARRLGPAHAARDRRGGERGERAC